MGLFTDTVTVYNKISDTEWRSSVIKGVQWTDKAEKKNMDGVLGIVKYASVTFPEGTYDSVVLNSANEEDCVIYGAVKDVVDGNRGSRIDDLLKKYPKGGLIKAVNDNSNRNFLRNIKVVIQ